MTKQEVSERFSGGHVKHMVTTHKAVQWLGRILGIVICVALIKWAPHDIGNRMLCYALVVCLLWWVHGLDVVLVYICEKALSSNRDRQIYVTISVVPLIWMITMCMFLLKA